MYVNELNTMLFVKDLVAQKGQNLFEKGSDITLKLFYLKQTYNNVKNNIIYIMSQRHI